MTADIATTLNKLAPIALLILFLAVTWVNIKRTREQADRRNTGRPRPPASAERETTDAARGAKPTGDDR